MEMLLTLCDDGVDSKFVLKRESIKVDFPSPVSPDYKIDSDINTVSVNDDVF